jgi:hypothetical protein
MKQSISAKQKKRGRPPTGITPMVGVRLSSEVRQAVETWAKDQSDQPSLSEAIRRLVELGLSGHAIKIPRIIAPGDALTTAASDGPGGTKAPRRKKTRQRRFLGAR